MIIYLKQSTAGQEVALGPFLDAADAVTPLTTLTINNTDIKLWKNTTSAQVNKNSGGATHDANGIYIATFDATDTNILGSTKVTIQMAGALAVSSTVVVLSANIYDSLIGGVDLLQVDVTSMLGLVGTSLPATQASVDSVKVDTGTSIPSSIGGLNNFDPTSEQVIVSTNNDKTGYTIFGSKNTLDDLTDISTTQVKTQVDSGLSDIRLDELLSVPLASQPTFESLFADLTENDLGTQRFTANALEQAPTGGGGGDATQAKQDEILSNISTLNDFDYTSEQVIVGSNNDKSNYSVAGGVDVTSINGSATAAVNLAISADLMVQGSTTAGTATTTTFSTDLTSTETNLYTNRAIVFSNGEASRITGYNGSTKVLTVDTLRAAPVVGVTFTII